MGLARPAAAAPRLNRQRQAHAEAAPRGRVLDAQGRFSWDFDAFAFVEGAAPATVHPVLGRQERLNNQAGLFKVVDGVWRLRGFDLSHITLIEGRRGCIVVDALTSPEAAAAAMAFGRQHLGPRPVSALIYTHSHMDVFGGALGGVTAEEATSENLLAGTAMGRCAAYMYGSRLPPNRIVTEPRQEMTLDGAPMVFFNVPGAEAPAKLMPRQPQQRAFGSADMMVPRCTTCTRCAAPGCATRCCGRATSTSRWPPRGRPRSCSSQHTWPVWGREAIRAFIVRQRDAYRYIHDQTVRMMNAGLTAPEIAETLMLPSDLELLKRSLEQLGYLVESARWPRRSTAPRRPRRR